MVFNYSKHKGKNWKSSTFFPIFFHSESEKKLTLTLYFEGINMAICLFFCSSDIVH